MPLRAPLFVLLLALPAWTSALTGRVVAIADGDTLTILDSSNRQHKIRLAEIDTPEKAQPYGTKAKKALSDLAYGKVVRVEVQTVDRYGLTVGRVYVGEIDVCAELVRQGAAWVYRKYAKDPGLLLLEEEAQRAGRNLRGQVFPLAFSILLIILLT